MSVLLCNVVTGGLYEMNIILGHILILIVLSMKSASSLQNICWQWNWQLQIADAQSFDFLVCLGRGIIFHPSSDLFVYGWVLSPKMTSRSASSAGHSYPITSPTSQYWRGDNLSAKFLRWGHRTDGFFLLERKTCPPGWSHDWRPAVVECSSMNGVLEFVDDEHSCSIWLCQWLS